MSTQTYWESIRANGTHLLETFKTLLHEGNVRRVIIEHEGKTVAEFPVTAGVVGVLLAPMVAAIGVLIALLQDCTIHVEHADGPADR